MGEDFAEWIGRSVTREDRVTERLLAEYRVTLDPYLFKPQEKDVCPPGFHWGLAPATPAMNELGADGAEAKGLFLPPIPLKRRMWAGGTVETFAAIRIGMDVTRRAAIADVSVREGRSGPLCFVSVIHEITAQGTLLVRELQDLVFREGQAKPSAVPAPADSSNDVEWTVDPSAALLFRFSVFTFNGHRVHYDAPYAKDVEGYGGLLVHGPLQAALLLNQAAVALGRVPAHFDYRCTAPLIGGSPATVTTRRSGNGATGRVADHGGVVTAEARSAFDSI